MKRRKSEVVDDDVEVEEDKKKQKHSRLFAADRANGDQQALKKQHDILPLFATRRRNSRREFRGTLS